MTLSDLRKLDRDDVLAWLGMRRQSSVAGRLAGIVGLFAGGLLLGAGVALLMAPKPGRELREDLRTKLGRRPPNGAAASESDSP